MQLNELEKNDNLIIENNFVNEQTQNKFLETTLGKTINTAIDIGIRAILPDFLEDQIISIKDNLLNYGLKDGISKTIEDAITLGKSAMGLVTGKFDTISQMQNAVQTGGLVDGISGVLDYVIDKTKQAGVINNSIANTIKQGKNSILNQVEKKIENTFLDQLKAMEQINQYMENWKNYFEGKNIKGMEKEYKKMENEIKKLAPIEKTLNDAKIISNLHNLIKNKGNDFNLTKEELALAEKL